MKISVIGQGYVGLTISVGALSAGHNVIGVDYSEGLVTSLKSGKSHIEGISDSDISSGIKSGKFLPTSDYSLIAESDVVVIAVPTPLNEFGRPDLAMLESAAKSVGGALKKRALIINESTSFPGTLRDVIRPLVEKGSPFDHMYAISPERVDPGNKNFGTKNTPRIVGGMSDEARDKAVEFYRSFCDHVVPVSSPEVAEAAKLFENTFRFINIGLVNEFAQVMGAMGIPVDEVLSAAATKPYGFMPFHPNVGIGGHCIPVDPTYLSFAADNAGQHAEFIDLANAINLDMPNYVAKRVESDLAGLKGKKLLVVGIAYKPNVSDLRESPSLILIEKLKSAGAEVQWHDEYVKQLNGQVSVPLIKNDYDATIIAVAHSNLDSEQIAGTSNYVFDCTGMFGDISGVAKL